MGIDEIAPRKLIREAYVVITDKPIGSGITRRDLASRLAGRIEQDDIVVCYTGCSDHWGEVGVQSNYTYLTKGAAEYLASSKVRAVALTA